MRRFENQLFCRRKTGHAPVYFGLLTAAGAIVAGIADVGAAPDAAPARQKTTSCEERFGADFVPIVLRAPGERRRVVCAALPAREPVPFLGTAP